MSRFTVWGRRSFAAGIPALLLALLVGCGKRDAEIAQETARIESKREPTDENLSANGAVLDPSPQPNTPDKGLIFCPPNRSVLIIAYGSKHTNSAFGYERPNPVNNTAPKAGGEYNAQNAEAYGVYRENEFRSPLVAPLSTFSADVNTASYSNVRRMLNEGKLPPASAVFLAEFVNYFPYQYAQPKGDDPVAFHVEMGPCPWNRQHHLVRVGVRAYQIPADKLPARNLVVALLVAQIVESDEVPECPKMIPGALGECQCFAHEPRASLT